MFDTVHQLYKRILLLLARDRICKNLAVLGSSGVPGFPEYLNYAHVSVVVMSNCPTRMFQHYNSQDHSSQKAKTSTVHSFVTTNVELEECERVCSVSQGVIYKLGLQVYPFPMVNGCQALGTNFNHFKLIKSFQCIVHLLFLSHM